MDNQIIYKNLTTKQLQTVKLSCYMFGNNGYIQFGSHQIAGHRADLAAELRRLAAELDQNTVSKRQITAAELPPELASPETAWPFLVNRFPWLFADIDTSREPYAEYLRPARANPDAEIISRLKNPSQADIAEALFGDRTKTGGAYRRRILAAMRATTTSSTAQETQKQQMAA